MARVTVEDCMQVVENRFELVALASQRAKDITSGSPLTIDRDNDKNAVIALREIAQEKVDTAVLREVIIKNMQRKGKFDKPEVDNFELTEESDDGMEIVADMNSFEFEDLPEDMSFMEDNLDTDD